MINTNMSFCLLACFFFWAQSAGAQNCTELQPTKATNPILAELLDEDTPKITEVCQLAAGDENFSVRVSYGGFDEKEYLLKAELLDANRRPVPGCEPISEELTKGSSSSDLSLRFQAGKGNYTKPYVTVKYLKISISEKDGLLSDFDLPGINLSGATGEYKVDHRFRVGVGEDGTSNVTVAIGFTPVKRAATIKQ